MRYLATHMGAKLVPSKYTQIFIEEGLKGKGKSIKRFKKNIEKSLPI